MPQDIELLVKIAHALELSTFGGALAGSLTKYCKEHPGVAGCVNKRDILNLDSVPGMRVPVSSRQAATGPCGVPQYNFDLCHDQLINHVVKDSIPAEGQAKFEAVPPACMDLATVLTGACNGDGPRPTPCGSDCLLYTGMTEANYATLSNVLSGKQAS
ncbi:hypothetical protein F4780DRAFT_164899 [Xylariomycetidae sp. FL0641]|nr:hypothetical protein F4780DRAFT_164899 [Xylariomycetidae sp. FL0641]